MKVQTILSLDLRYERDVVRARQRAREIAALLGFDRQDQIRLATATSEIARNAFRYARNGKVEFELQTELPQTLRITVSDQGPGIANLQEVLDGQYKSDTGLGMGIVGTRRLMDSFIIETTAVGTQVFLGKTLPPHAPIFTSSAFKRLTEELNKREPQNPFEEIERQNRELLKTLADLRARQDELALLNRELEDTNRGVVALYAELDERADYLRRASELKTNFLSNMSHEFRTPLNSIISLSRILQEKTDGDLSSEQEKQVRFIQRSAQELYELVNDLLDLAKVEAGKVTVKPKEFVIQELFGALRGMLRPLLLDSSLDLVFEDCSDLPVMNTDDGKVSQILRNFISNALKFTPEGEVRVSASLGASGTIIFAVKDTGIGIAPNDQEFIFKEFTQIENAIQDRVKGTGLGLPLCRNLAELLGGSVSVESELGKGSSFYAVIPINYRGAAPEETHEAGVDKLVSGKVPVLIIEDNPETSFIYGSYLHKTEFQPITVTSVEKARRTLANIHPAAIVLDVYLGGQNSAEYIRELRVSPQTERVPVVVISVMDEARKVLSYGADTFIQKPVDQESFCATLYALAGRKERKKVLLVDDNEVSRYVLREKLSAWDFQILEARGGREALALIDRETPDLVFLDLLMPDIGGLQVLEELRASSHTRSIPVIIHSSKTLDSKEEEAARDQTIGVFPKRSLTENFATKELKDLLLKANVLPLAWMQRHA
jgi:signal transduction histidine kinase/DNA-binding response OmpR family regulator